MCWLELEGVPPSSKDKAFQRIFAHLKKIPVTETRIRRDLSPSGALSHTWKFAQCADITVLAESYQVLYVQFYDEASVDRNFPKKCFTTTGIKPRLLGSFFNALHV